MMHNIAVCVAYVCFAGAGAFAFFSPSVALAQQGGAVIVYAYAILCVLGAVLGLAGIALRRTVAELMGVVGVITASLTWTSAVIFQAFATDNPSFGVAACMGCALAGLVLQRWLDARRSLRR
ncbi:MAG: hypothetical protein HOY78_02355 [Saccharothrix sp.]|nr:hypothetical protein [Saccharothrix sp.]